MPRSSFSAPTGAGLFRRLGLLWIVGAAARIAILAVPPVLPLIHDDLHLSETQVGLLSGLPLGLFAVAAVPGSLLVARIGVRQTLLIGIALTALASGGRAASLDVLMLYAATVLMGIGIAVMQPALPALVRAWTPGHIGLGTAVYTNGMVIGATVGPVFTIPFLLPWLGGSWRLDIAAWSALIAAIGLAFALFGPPITESPDANSAGPASAPRRWWPAWNDPLIWLLGLAFGGTNSLYFGANAFVPDYLVAHGHGDLVGAALAWLNGSQLIASFTLLFVADRLHRRAWPYVVFGLAALAALLGIILGGHGWIVPATAVLGCAAAVPFVLILALPPALSAPADVPRTAAGMFTISYAGAVIVPVVCGAVWDLTGAAWTAFLPLAVCAVVMATIGAWLARYRGAAAVSSQ
ncbi:MAG TPA: MFS transporter [Xanthobacteraceae bacterium]|nr:MFS transporter [Xanthobacteraceae bacterium]